MSANLATIPSGYARAYMAGYREGAEHGYARCLDDLEAEEDRFWAVCSRTVRAQASSPRYSKLADRRGEPERADRAREWERANGLGTVA